MQWKTITIVGVGLLGGSIGLCCRHTGIAARVVGLVRRPQSIKECVEAGAVDYATTDPGEAISESELVILCTPIGQMVPVVKTMLPYLQKGTIVTDVGSVKWPVVKQLEPLISRANGYFVGAHPMAGSEKTGVANARGELFRGAVCVITPTTKTNRAALCNVKSFWQALGATTLEMPPYIHDRLVAYGSHLPHVTAVSLVRTVLNGKRNQQEYLCASGFRDSTRVASSSDQMWCDILATNNKNVIKAIDDFIRELRRFRTAIAKGDRCAIGRFLNKAKQQRDNWCLLKEKNSMATYFTPLQQGAQIKIEYGEKQPPNCTQQLM